MSRLVGLQAPDFTATAVVDQEFKEISLSQYRGKYVVLFFYPLDFTFVCPTEIIAFSERYADFSSRNCEVLGVSVDSQFSHLAWVQTDRKNGGIGDIAYPLVADLKKDIARSYEVLDEDAGVALRGLFIIDPDGVIMQSTINNLPVGRSVDETLRLLQAFQHIRKNPDEGVLRRRQLIAIRAGIVWSSAIKPGAFGPLFLRPIAECRARPASIAQAGKQPQSVEPPRERVAGPLRMGHQPQHIAACVG